MGSSYNIGCKECDYNKSFHIGIGMMYSPHNLMDFESEFALIPSLIRSKKTVAQIKELLNNKGAVIANDYGHEIFRCPRCGEFYERFFIHLDYDGGSFEVEYKCSKCKTKLKQIDYEAAEVTGWVERKINLQKYPCPKCGKHSLFEDDRLMELWD